MLATEIMEVCGILITLILPLCADIEHRDYHQGGKPQSRLRSQVAVTFSHNHTLLLNVAILCSAYGRLSIT